MARLVVPVWTRATNPFDLTGAPTGGADQQFTEVPVGGDGGAVPFANNATVYMRGVGGTAAVTLLANNPASVVAGGTTVNNLVINVNDATIYQLQLAPIFRNPLTGNVEFDVATAPVDVLVLAD